MSRTYHQRARILVVDNSEINREMLNDILGETYEIRLAGSGREALEILEKEHWNLELVLLKLEMPDIDGYELLEIMREDVAGGICRDRRDREPDCRCQESIQTWGLRLFQTSLCDKHLKSSYRECDRHT